MAAKLDDVQACVFDAYGTLFDFASATRGCRDLLGDDLDKLTTLWRDKQLQYTWLRGEACRFLASHWRCPRLRLGHIEARSTGTTR